MVGDHYGTRFPPLGFSVGREHGSGHKGRATLARQEGVAAYMIFPDRTLIEMARAKPVDLWALRSVHGVGERKRDAYGQPFVEAVAEFLADAAKRAG